MHIFWNMIMFYWFSRVFQEMIGDKKLVPVYLLGAAAGGIAYLLLYNLVPSFAANNSRTYLIGASASVYAVVVAAATIAPNYRFHLLLIGPVPIKYLALAGVLLSFLALRGSNAGGDMAHLGGALIGYLYVVFYRKGTDMAQPFLTFFDWIAGLFEPRRKFNVSRGRASTSYSSQSPKRTIHIKPQKNPDRESTINEILDKINEKGYDGLTKKEKEILFRESNKG
jgi:hypothetical protein